MQEDDRDRLDPLALQRGDEVRQWGEIDRLFDLPLVVGSFGQLRSKVPLHERLGLVEGEVEKVGPVAAGDLKHVPEPRGGDQSGLDPFSFCQRVDDDGGAVREEVELRGRNTRLGKRTDNALLEVRGCRVDLGDLDLPRLTGCWINVEVH